MLRSQEQVNTSNSNQKQSSEENGKSLFSFLSKKKISLDVKVMPETYRVLAAYQATTMTH